MPRTDLTVYSSNLPKASGPRANVLSTLAFVGPTALGAIAGAALGSVTAVVAGVVAGAIASMSPKIAQQWERAVVLRLGRYVGLRGPGPFWVIPFVDKVGSWVDQRTITSSFAAEETLTSDTVPVNVDAV